ncbi:MAG: hypothetical protein J6W45_08885, partial [Bacteroidales bacterium]|nr:hypothetical protein [Bacteroidales bacterium]
DRANAKGGKDNITVVLAIAENPNARPKQAVVEPPRHQQENNIEDRPAEGKKSRKTLWICLIALLLIIAAFVGGNFLATKGVVCVPQSPSSNKEADTTVLKKDLDSLNGLLKEANDTINELKGRIEDARNSLSNSPKHTAKH